MALTGVLGNGDPMSYCVASLSLLLPCMFAQCTVSSRLTLRTCSLLIDQSLRKSSQGCTRKRIEARDEQKFEGGLNLPNTSSFLKKRWNQLVVGCLLSCFVAKDERHWCSDSVNGEAKNVFILRSVTTITLRCLGDSLPMLGSADRRYLKNIFSDYLPKKNSKNLQFPKVTSSPSFEGALIYPYSPSRWFFTFLID